MLVMTCCVALARAIERISQKRHSKPGGYMDNKLMRLLTQCSVLICLCSASAWPTTAETLARRPEQVSQSEEDQNLVSSPTITTQADAKQGWQATSLTAAANQTIELSVIAGQWTHWVGTIPYNNGVGGGYVCADYIPPDSCGESMPTVATGALIGKIGNQVFAIRNGTTVVASQPGPLYLRINDGDNGLSDNDGILSVQIGAISQRIFLPLIIKPTPAPIVTKTVFTIAYMD